ncbi:hypothetical protein brsh051_20780 [Brooklawnia propionicigenes]|uniref:Uncharacterized protein n=1 Tax=Brooklawnia propionicigenes TaxID=3041175 RepID=A0AAN0KAN5_9ACTN|nr:hypothetical protein [Brooklawnia sp. SH051]BEH02797.1 hypothetical protein brsh051_20780 [Brooklawnia sp. SH051]
MPPRRSHNQLPFTLSGTANLTSVHQTGNGPEVLKLCRLRYAGYANQWGFAIYRASHDGYEDSFLPTGVMSGPAEDALDTACGLYLNDPTAWI